jgi:hypothetical protein
MKTIAILIGLIAILGAAGCKNPPPAQTPEDGQKQQPGPAEPIPAPPDDETGMTDDRDPATLVRAVFEALQKSTDGVTGGHGKDSPFPSDKEIAKTCQKAKEEFMEFLALLKEKGLDPSKAAIKEIKTDKAFVKNGMGFSEDLTLVLQQGNLVIPVTIDDVLLTPRGWLIADGLKLRE